MFLIIGTICAAICIAGFIASRNKLMKEYQNAIVMGSMFAVTGVIIFGIFAYNPKAKPAAKESNTAPGQQTPNIAQQTEATAHARAAPSSATSETASELVALRKPGDTFKDCAVCPEMVVAPAGNNDIGEEENSPNSNPNEQPMVWVRFKRPFAVARFETQVAEFKAFASATNFKPSGSCNTDGVGGRNANYANPGLNQKSDHPVVCVSFDDATRYTDWLSEHTGKTYRLMSEARWEYVRRSETHVTQDNRSADDDILPEKGNIKNDDWLASTQEVGQFHSNQFLIFDMMGNAAEWTSDCWQENHSHQSKDGSALRDQGDCNARAVRGGSWDERAHAARPASRRKVAKDVRDWRIGFRVMRTMENTKQESQLAN